MKRLLAQIIASIAGLAIASFYIPGVIVRAYPDSSFFGFSLNYQWEIFAVLGLVLGLLNYFLKPILKAISLPLEFITLGLFTIVINMAILWLIDLLFDELYISGVLPVFYTTAIVWALNLVISFFIVKKD